MTARRRPRRPSGSFLPEGGGAAGPAPGGEQAALILAQKDEFLPNS